MMLQEGTSVIGTLLSSYRPIPTSQSRTIKLSGRPSNHIITYAILTPSMI
jgi:hypothetical protein